MDTIELHNPTAGAVDIGGWYLSDTDGPYRKFQIPNGTILPAGGYVTFDETNHFNTSGGSNLLDFALDSARGDDVWLLEGDTQSNLVSFVDHAEFGAARNGESFGRWPDGVGSMYPMQSLTLGGSNAGPRVGPLLVSEFMYAPAGSDPNLEFVEVLNTGPVVESLDNWRLAGDVDFDFPSNTFLAPGEVLLVLPFDPAQAGNAGILSGFRSHYGTGTNEPLVGGFLGALSDEGATFRLLRADSPPVEEPTLIPMLLEDEVTFSPLPPWPVEAAGGGVSLIRRGPGAWGNAAESWRAGTTLGSTPGTSPSADKDGDNLPDAYEIEVYGSTNVVGSAVSGDTDEDGVTDELEYVAGTSATNPASRLLVTVNQPSPDLVMLSVATHEISGPGYFGLERFYSLEQRTELGSTGTWQTLVGFSNIPPTGTVMTHTNGVTNQAWSVRARVELLESP